MLTNCLNNMSVHGCSPIQGTTFYTSQDLRVELNTLLSFLGGLGMIITFSRESCTFIEFSAISMTFYGDFSAICFLTELKKYSFTMNIILHQSPPKAYILILITFGNTGV